MSTIHDLLEVLDPTIDAALIVSISRNFVLLPVPYS